MIVTEPSPRPAAPPPLIASGRHLFRFLLIAAAIAAAMFFQARRPSRPNPDGHLVLYGIFIATELLLTWFVVLGVRAHGGYLRDLIGRTWRRPLDFIRDLAIGAASIIVLRASSYLLLQLLGSWHRTTGFLLPTTVTDRIAWVPVAMVAGFCEEIIYRGYLLRQFQAFAGSVVAAITLQAVVFGAGHFYQGWKAATIAMGYGLIFGVLAAWRRSVLPGAIAHTGVDLIGGLI